MFLAEAVSCAKVNGKDRSRSQFIVCGSVRGTWNHLPPCCRVISKSLHHPESLATPTVLAQFKGWPCPQTSWSRGCHISTELYIHLMPSFKRFLSWYPLNSVVFTHLPLAAPLNFYFCEYPGGTLSSPPPRSATFLTLTYPPSDLHSSPCQELGIGTLQIRLQKAFF